MLIILMSVKQDGFKMRMDTMKAKMVKKSDTRKQSLLQRVGKAIPLTQGGGGRITEYFVGGGIGRYS